ncbi:hypothetical protein K9M79_08360 [Candidatus Woesearchaeota archaeon]|nr:hypothetical protein [Candidatus Woesearchaeota archaeon]
MRIIHQLGSNEISKETEKQPALMLTNWLGSYFTAGLDSRYGGLFMRIDGRVLKILDSVVPRWQKQANCINKFSRIEHDSIRYFMPDRINALVCESEGDHELHFDIKEPYDDSEWGRDYKVDYNEKHVILRFPKENIVVVVYGGEFLDCQKWVEKEYVYDRDRGSEPYKRFVFCPFTVRGDCFVIVADSDESKAVMDAKYVWNHLSQLKEQRTIYETATSEEDFASLCAMNSLNGYVHGMGGQRDVGLYAGLPWFFQVWTRDEAIAVQGIVEQESRTALRTARNLLMREMSMLQADGRLPNRFPSTVTGCADGIGWHFVRWEKLLDIATRKGLLYTLFREEELKIITHNLEHSLQALKSSYEKDYLIYSGKQESWMDSIPREGALIEMQAMHLQMHKLMYKLTYDNNYNKVQQRIQTEVRRAFFKENYLWDRADDPLVRPNLFLAAYICPDLLKRPEWEQCFDIVLPKLWLDYGGLSTISSDSRLFHNEYSGQNPDSYHNGDSWFWVNNIAALVLERVNKQKYSDYISKIKIASTNDILWSGVAGHSSELSSAKELRSEGSPSQAWSASTLFELLKVVH